MPVTQKIVVTKEKLAYYHNKVKDELDAKGTVKGIWFQDKSYTPDANGVVTLPDTVATLSSDETDESFTFGFKAKDDPQQTTYDDHGLKFDYNDSDDGLTIASIKNGTTTNTTVLPNKTYVDGLAAACSTLRLEKVQTLPAAADGQDGVIYLVANQAVGQNVYDEYFRVNTGTEENPVYGWELFGTTAVDLDGYLQETDVIEITNAEIDELFTQAQP